MVSSTSSSFSNLLLALTFALLLLNNIRLSEARPKSVCDYFCQGEDCNVPPKDCKFGFVRNPCNQYECYKGPGEECGKSPLYRRGTCMPSLECICNQCTGCILEEKTNGNYKCHLYEGFCNEDILIN